MFNWQRFKDRKHAGTVLAARLAPYAHQPGVLVLGLPRGGVPVAYEVACALGAPLDVVPVRKLGMPGQKEFALGAIAGGGVCVLDRDLLRDYGIAEGALATLIQRESAELARRAALYRGGRPPLALAGRTVILVDDGLATGSTMLAALAAVRAAGPARVVVAVPVGAPDTCEKIRAQADELVCLIEPEPFYAVALWYDDFSQTGDDEVLRLLAAAPAPEPSV